MTKKHFILIAGVLKHRANGIDNSNASDEQKHYALFELRNTMYDLGDTFKVENPRFDKGTFYKACEIQEMLEKYIRVLEIV
jgi:hypothetical protein